jgi:hypothetical protein
MKQNITDIQQELIYKTSGWAMIIAFVLLLLLAIVNIFV